MFLLPILKFPNYYSVIPLFFTYSLFNNCSNIQLFNNSMTQDLHDFLGLNEPFFNHSSDVVFTAQEGGVAYLSCEVALPTF